jgi:hypothetical protein
MAVAVAGAQEMLEEIQVVLVVLVVVVLAHLIWEHP